MKHRNMVARLKCYTLVILCLCMLYSCSSTKAVDNHYLYFSSGLDSMHGIEKLKERIIRINDVLNIQIYSKSLNQDQASMFNIPATASGSATGGTSAGSAGVTSGYLVNTDGDVEIAIIGKVHAAGLTREQFEASLVSQLVNYIKDPSVVVRLPPVKVNVLGEVKDPGVHEFNNDGVTIMDAIGAAHDLTDQGKRHDITVIRDDGKTRKIYKVDITSGSLFQSPAYYMQANDIVYVGASDKKLHEINRKPESDSMKGWQFALSIISVAASLLFVTYTITK